MKRCKNFEYMWIFVGSFYVRAYTARHTNGKTYVIYAHDFNDMEIFMSRLELEGDGIARQTKDCFDHFEKRKILSYLPDKKGNPKKKPFWYRGRVYELR